MDDAADSLPTPPQSSDEDLRELLASPDGQNDVIRLEVTARPHPQPATETEQPAEATTAPAPSASAAAAAADDWTEIESVEDEPLLAGFNTQVYGTTIGTPVAVKETVASDEMAEETTATAPIAAAAADPAEPVLPGSFANRLDALIDAEFPRRSPTAATPTVAAAGSDSAATDPADESLSPLDDPAASTAPRQQGAGSDAPAFSTLPGSFSSILSGLPSHAEAFSAQLATLVGSPDSALGRLSALLSNPTEAVSSGAINLSDLSSSFSNLGIDVGAAVHEVLQSVRSEAEGVRSEFERFKTQVEAEKTKFEAEVRAALEEAKRARAEAANANAAPAQATDPEEVPATGEEDKSSNTRSTHGHGHGHAHRETKEARRSARADKRCYESRYSWAPRDANNEPHRGMNTGGWCRQPKGGSTPAARAGWGGGGGSWSGPTPSFATPPFVMRDAPYGMPGSMPFSAANPVPKGSWSGWGGAPATAGSSSSPANDLPPAASASASPSAAATNFAGQEDDDKPVLLTAFLGSARTIGFDVDDASIRIALTDIWCESNGRGMSAMLDKACEELFS